MSVNDRNYNPEYIGDTHDLKVLPGYFLALIGDLKTFEVRKKDRDYKVNDLLVLNEWNPDIGYTGARTVRKISYILDNEEYCKDGYVILSMKKHF